MSELKVIKIELNNHGKPIASIQGTTSYYGISPNDTFYPQEEVDAAIAELKGENESLKGDIADLRDDRKSSVAIIDELNAENAQLKAKLESVQASMYADLVDANMENRRLKRALWLARAKDAWSNARWFNLCNPDYVRNRQGFTPNNETQKQMNSIEWARLFYNNYKKLIAKAEEYK